MKLTELHPEWVDAGRANGASRTGVGLKFDCPCGKCGRACFVAFQNPIDGGGPVDPSHALWTRTGESFETLTLTPSILRNTDRGGCGWHGWITNGEVTTV